LPETTLGPLSVDPVRRLGVPLLIAFGIFLRLGFLGTDSVWLDEAFSVSHALQHDTAALLTTAADQLHPPLYYVILRWALLAGGVSEAVARAPSAIASVLTLGVVFVLAKGLRMSRVAAVHAVMLLALAPIDLWYAQEARMYAAVTLTAVIFALGLVVDSWWGAVLAAVGLTAGLYLDFTMVPLALALTSIWFVWWWHIGRDVQRILRAALVWCAGVALFLPLWPHVLHVVGLLDRVTFFSHMLRIAGATRITASMVLVALISMTVALALGSATAVRGLGNDRFRRFWSWSVPLLFVLTTVLLTVPRAYSAKQILVTGWPFVILVVAWTLTDFPSARWWLGATVAVSTIAAIGAVLTPRADWRGVVAFLNSADALPAVIRVDPAWNAIPYGFYNPKRPALTELAAPVRFAGSDPTGETCLIADRSGARPPTSPTEAWLDEHLRLISATAFARLEVRCYGRR
jgi:uncharacterized membrane protein